MKNKKAGRKADYSIIKRKFYSYILVALIVAVVLVVFLLEFIRRQGSIGDWIVGLLQYGFRLSYANAMSVYRSVIQGNLSLFIGIAIILCFLFLSRIIFATFIRYFDEANAGIDALIRGESGPMELSVEMAFMERKLNTLRQTLEMREQAAKLAEQRKNDLVMYLAHDIKTPLTSVIGYLSLLDEAPDMPAEQRAKYVHITLDKAYRLEQLIGEFFEITRYNLQIIALSKQNVDLCYMLAQMADEFYPLLSAGGKRITIHAPEDLTVHGDPDKLARVFNNILRNAVAYSPGGSAIDITAAVSDLTVSIVFTNDGNIPKDRLAVIFDKFYRLDAARSSDTGGAGLGLAVAKEIIAAHGGILDADSDGRQISFTVKLPFAPAQDNG